MKGMLYTNELKLVKKKKNFIDESKNEYYYELGFSNNEDLLLLTAGKAADVLQIDQKYLLGLDFIDKKLKMRDFVEAENVPKKTGTVGK